MTEFLSSTLLASHPEIFHGFGTALLPVPPEAFLDDESAERFKDRSLAFAKEAARRGLPQLPAEMVTLKQIHTTNVLLIRRGDAYVPPAECIRGDAIVSDCPGVLVAVKTADCLPVLVAAPRKGIVAAVHAGWRGSEAGILGRVLRRLIGHFGVAPGELRLAFGPSARACCYEVDKELAQRFAAHFGQDAVRQAGDRMHLDLVAVNRLQAQKAGLAAEQMDDLCACTLCSQAPEFYSFRRQGRAAGRLLNYIGLAAADDGLRLRVAGLKLGAERHMTQLEE